MHASALAPRDSQRQPSQLWAECSGDRRKEAVHIDVKHHPLFPRSDARQRWRRWQRVADGFEARLP
eukprot:scaffold247599_cov26-Tisochrysis_lutea.AAC.4